MNASPTSGELMRRAGNLDVRTMIFDVEPLVAYWDSGQEVLDQGIARVCGEVGAMPDVQVLCFATNSLRRSPVLARPSGGLGKAGAAAAVHTGQVTAAGQHGAARASMCGT